MAEILSQSEIDALIASLSDTGAAPASPGAVSERRGPRRVRVYDFRRPDKFSKDQLRTLHMVHEGLTRLLTTYYTGCFRTVVQLVVGSVDQGTYADFIRAVQNPSVLCPFQLHPLHGTCVLEINPVVAFPMLDRMFGGSGTALPELRDVTEIEKQVLMRVVRGTLDCLKEAWANLTAVEPEPGDLETNPLFVQEAAPNEIVVTIALDVRVGEHVGVITLCFPYLTLEPILAKLTAHTWFGGLHRPVQEQELALLHRKLNQAPVEVVAHLGSSAVTIGELLQLAPGDVLLLEQRTDQPVPVLVGDQLKFRAEPGQRQGRLALQVAEVVVKEDPEDV